MIVSDAHNFASRLSRNMEEIQRERQMYIEKLSSGKKVEKSTDDAGALSNKIKQVSEQKRLKAVNRNLQNAKSYLEVRDSALTSVHKIYDRMAQLSTMAMDVTKNDSDRENYEKEFQELRDAALKLSREKFNGINLFRDKSYTLVNKNGAINWTDSKAEVDALNASDSKNEHYLATITTELEQIEIAFQIGDVGINAWLGGQDIVENDWRWTEGPEGKANGGTGTPFWNGKFIGHPTDDGTFGPVDGMFENWGNREPNGDSEDYLQISQAPQLDGTRGAWNDLGNTSSSNPTYQPLGYVRETDQGNLVVNDDVEGGGFEIGNALFQKFIFSSMISVDSIENAKKALGSLENILTGVSNARAIGGASLSRLEKEITANENLSMETEKSLSRIEDVDMAITASRLARAEIKMQSTTAIFAQANKLFNQRNYVDELLS
ncbi:flagellin [Opitutales bacterium]|nr:flagellin [Opitutales bacterium]